MDVEIYDIEVMGGMFLYCGYNPSRNTWVEYEISEYRNDLFALVKHLDGLFSCHPFGQFMVSYNGISYDMQAIQYIMDNYERWIDYDSRRIINIIKKFSNKLIDDQNYGLFPPYREEEFCVPQIDLMRVHHYDNENKRTSLKWLEFSMDFYNVEEMPYPHTQESFSLQEIQEIKDYCRNDVEATYEFWKYTIGEVEHEEYKGKNKIQDRLDLIEEMKFPLKALSWSDVKLGDEINLKTYCEITGLSPKEVKNLRRNRKPTKRFTYGDCIPESVKFRSIQFQAFYEKMRKVKVNLLEKEEYPLIVNGVQFMIAKGGIHSNEKNRIVEPRINEILRDADVSSQYPHFIIKRGLFPSHLGKPWLVGYTKTRDKRLAYKASILTQTVQAAKRKIKGLSETFKLALNGGGFGMTNLKTSWQFDPFLHFSCTIGNQFEILMLIEDLLLEGIQTISANTDGIVCLFDKEKEEAYKRICATWEKKVGNTEHGKLEFADYKKIVQLSVNGYLAEKDDGTVKKKKEFLTDYLLEKNKSNRVVALALEQYFVYGKDIREFITNHQNIFDFCIGAKSSRNYHYETIDKDGKKEVYHRMIRYYVSTDGKKLYKIKNPECETDGAEISQCEAGEWRCTIANLVDKNKPILEYNINHEYYIQKAEERIYALERGAKRKGGKPDPNQTSLF